MDIRLIALDLDGTLLGADHAHVPERNRAALQAAADRGVQAAIASGRAWSLIRETAAQLPMVRYGILANGASVLDLKTGEQLGRRCLPSGQGLALIRLLLERDCPFEVYCEGNSYTQASQAAAIKEQLFSPEFQEVFERGSIQVESLASALAGKEIEKFNIFYVPPGIREALLAEAKAFGPLAAVTSFQDNLELAAEGANKGSALQTLCRRLDIPAGSVMAFGDAENDLEMLTWAKYSFAMANAEPVVKEAARYQTGANDEGGVGMAVERYVLEA